MCAKSTKGGSVALELTDGQRKSLLDCRVLDRQVKERLQQAGDGTQVVEFTIRQASGILDAAGTGADFADKATQRSLSRVSAMIVDALAHDALPGRKTAGPQAAKPDKDSLYQFKITLEDSAPPVWRRIHSLDCTLDELHHIIQMAMGWDDSHLHQFEICSLIFGAPEMLHGGFEGSPVLDSCETWLSEIVAGRKAGFRFFYEYDFGDSWRHEIAFEGCTAIPAGKHFPSCVEGQRACPPEDIGGVWGYAHFLEALADPNHERHDDYMEWASDFDPAAFDAAKANKQLAALRQRP